MTSPKDRNGILDNAAAFVRACFPAQVMLLSRNKCQAQAQNMLGLSSVELELYFLPRGFTAATCYTLYLISFSFPFSENMDSPNVFVHSRRGLL